MTVLILGAELLFWFTLILGFITRYIYNLKSLSNFILSSTIIIDFTLLFFTYESIQKYNSLSIIHLIATIYLAISIVYGPSIIKKMDNYFYKRRTSFSNFFSRKEAVLFILEILMIVVFIYLVQYTDRLNTFHYLVLVYIIILPMVYINKIIKVLSIEFSYLKSFNWIFKKKSPSEELNAMFKHIYCWSLGFLILWFLSFSLNKNLLESSLWGIFKVWGLFVLVDILITTTQYFKTR